jgi:FAD/FMN-containing dehydrogenase
VRAPYMRAEHGDALDVMKRIKDVMDPKGILNPGKIYPQDRVSPDSLLGSED